VIRSVQSPAITAVVSFSSGRGHLENFRMLVQIGSDVLALMRVAGLQPCPGQSFGGKDFRVQPTRISAWDHVAGIVCLVRLENSHSLIYKLWIDQRAVGGNSHNGFSLKLLCRSIITIENIAFRTSKAGRRERFTFVNDCIVTRQV